MLTIKKNPNRYENLINDVSDSDYQLVIQSVDLLDLKDFIMDLDNQNWVPSCYWKSCDWFSIGELYWAIYAYLVDRCLLQVEDCYYGYNHSRTDKYRKINDYYNPLEIKLYMPIVTKLVDGGFLDEKFKGIYEYYTLGKRYSRENKLNELIK